MNFVLTYLYSHIVYKTKQQLLLTPLKKHNEKIKKAKTSITSLWRHKNELCVNVLVQPYSLQNEATVTTDASEKAIARASS